MNENGGGDVHDSSPYQNHGAFEIAGGPVWTEGRFGFGLSCDGDDDMIVVPGNSSLQLTNGMTIAVWVRPAVTPTGWQHVVAKQNGATIAYYLAANSSLNTPFSGFNIAGEWRSAGGGNQLAAGVWTHLTSTYDGSTLRLYVNGQSIQSLVFNLPLETSGDPLHIGGNLFGENFAGAIDELRIYNVALDPSQVSAIVEEPVADPANAADPNAWSLYR
jgi:hypothetical protein